MDREADFVFITFEFQKNRQRIETITYFKTSSELLPVNIWAAIVLRLWSHKRTQASTYVNIVYVQGESKEVTSALLIKSLKISVKEIGEEHLGIKDDTVGTNSIRKSLVVFLYIKTFDTPKIMLM